MKVSFLVSALSLFLFLSLSCSPLSHVLSHAPAPATSHAVGSVWHEAIIV